MLHTDSAYALLSEALEKQGIEIESQQITENTVIAVASANGVDIKVWFDSESQQFGFDLLTGGQKKYDNLDDFMKYFQTYFSISTEIVPKAKILADTIEDSLGVQTIYDTFKGNKTAGYHVIFRILGDDKRELFITQNKTDKNLYKVEIVLYNEGKTQKKTEHEFLYEVDDEANITELVTLDSYITNLEKYKDSVSIKRVGAEEFVISYTEEESIHFRISIQSGKVLYKVLSYNDRDLNLELSLKDAYDIYALRDLVRNKLPKNNKETEKNQKTMTGVDEMLEESGMSTKNLSDVDDLMVSEEELKEIGEVKDIMPKENLADNTETGINLAEELMNSHVEDENKEVSEETSSEASSDIYSDDEEASFDNSETSSDAEEETSSNELVQELNILTVKLIKTDGRITGVLFITDNGLYKMNKDVALELIPLSIIETFTATIHNRGILITEEEKEQKKFAKDVSFDKEFCGKLVESLFN